MSSSDNINPVNSVVIKTLTVSKIADEVNKSHNFNKIDKMIDFLQSQTPLQSNYTVIRSPDPVIGWRSRVGEISSTKTRSSQLTFAEHIMLPGLTMKCRLTLSLEQAMILSEFLESSNKTVRFNCSSSDSKDEIVDNNMTTTKQRACDYGCEPEGEEDNIFVDSIASSPTSTTTVNFQQSQSLALKT